MTDKKDEEGCGRIICERDKGKEEKEQRMLIW
jgi:hypothetical protein